MNNDVHPNALIVIANCHCLPIADALAMSVRDITTDFIDVSFLQQPAMVAKVKKLLERDPGRFVFSFNLAQKFGDISTALLRDRLGAGMATFTNLHFSGLHPDISYIGELGTRLRGFFGDYHSKIVLFCFATGRSVAECLQLFNGASYEKIGFFNEFGRARAELTARDEQCDVKIAGLFFDMLLAQPCLYTVNHPTGPVFLEISQRLAAFCGMPHTAVEAVSFQNHLANSYIWPVYNEIAEYHALPYRTSQTFFLQNQRSSRGCDLSAFVEGCYASYAQVDRQSFSAMVEGLGFYKTLSDKL